jgi:hypothetical protein
MCTPATNRCCLQFVIVSGYLVHMADPAWRFLGSTDPQNWPAANTQVKLDRLSAHRQLPAAKTFFLKRRQKICLNLLIKKKRIVQLINGKLGENRYNKTTKEQHLKPSTSEPTSTLNLQPQTHDIWSTTT